MKVNVTRAAEGLDRRSFTVAEILRMQDSASSRTTRPLSTAAPEGEGWRSIVERDPDAVLTFAALPGFSAQPGSI